MELRIRVGKGGGTAWVLASCSGTYRAQDGKEKEYIERCCLKPGEYILICQNTDNSNTKRHIYGWNSGFIEIQGQKYCDDFVGRKAMRRVEIKCKVERLKLLHT